MDEDNIPEIPRDKYESPFADWQKLIMDYVKQPSVVAGLAPTEHHEIALEWIDDPRRFGERRFRLVNKTTNETHEVTEAQANRWMHDTRGQSQHIAVSPGGQVDLRRLAQGQRGEAMKIGLDYETYCELDLTTVGLDQYVSHPSFKVLLASIAYLDGTVQTLDFVKDHNEAWTILRGSLNNATEIAAHNAGFERVVTRRLGIGVEHERFRDTAVIARCKGAASSLDHAAQQLLGEAKMPQGRHLIQKFSCGENPPLWAQVKDDPDWQTFKDYCDLDAVLSLKLLTKFRKGLDEEWRYDAITTKMNQVGWHVDLDAVDQMQRLYEINRAEALRQFQRYYDPGKELNFNSPIQLQKWAKERGVNAVSFDEEHVDDYINRIEKKLHSRFLSDDKRNDYEAVLDLLRTKRTIGGSSLKKLKVIKKTIGTDGRLRNQYMHCGAGQTYRTSGRGVQMQNLKRLTTIRDMSDLYDPSCHWSNDDLAENLRQVFKAENPKGSLIVGDFSSVEARGLAYLAGQENTLDAFRQGMDLYKVQAASIFNVSYDDVTKDQRRTGKVGVLACGYQAGGGAVQSFAKGMGVEMSEGEAAKLVSDWRRANPQIVGLWQTLDDLLHEALGNAGNASEYIGNGLEVEVWQSETPQSLKDQHPGAQSLTVLLRDRHGEIIVERVFHGCYRRGRSICYYKPDAKNGQLWSGSYKLKGKGVVHYNIYGGKLSGILTQSLCRQLFFWCMDEVDQWCSRTPGIRIIGQFHDEIVLEYDPDVCELTLNECINEVTVMMQFPHQLVGFPLDAEVKSDHRYTK